MRSGTPPPLSGPCFLSSVCGAARGVLLPKKAEVVPAGPERAAAMLVCGGSPSAVVPGRHLPLFGGQLTANMTWQLKELELVGGTEWFDCY